MIIFAYTAFTIPILFTVSFYMSICILIMFLCKKKLINFFSAKLSYILYIIIALRCLFVVNFHILMTDMPTYMETLAYTQIRMRIDEVRRLINWMDRQNYLETIQWIWILGVIMLSIYYIYTNFIIHKTINRLQIELKDPSMYAVLEKQKSKLNIKKAIKVYQVEGIGSPMIVGLFHSKILIPKINYTSSELQYIFLHELIHHKRKDNILKLILTLTTIIHWFNPLIYVLRKQFNEVCELSCDEAVIHQLYNDDIKNYSLLLLKTIKHKNVHVPSLEASYFNINKKSFIKFRIEHMFLSKRFKHKTILINTFIITALVTTIMIISMIEPLWIMFSQP